MLLHYATQRHGTEHRAWQENHDRSVEFLEQVSRRNKNSNKTHKKCIISKH